MLTDFREWLNTLTANEMGLFRGLLKVIGGFLFRQANSRNNSDQSGDQKISIKTPDGMEVSMPQDTSPAILDEYFQAIGRYNTSQIDRADEQSPRSIDPQKIERAAEDLRQLAADKAIKDAEDVLNRALKAANKGDPEQSVRILEPLRSKYQSTKDTADRELARLAFVTATLIFANDPVRARPYLEEAATLAPDNFIYLITYGRDLEVTGQSEKAKEIFMNALKVAESENNQRNIAWAKDDIGRIQEVQGDLEAALRSYQDGLNIAQKLAREDPSNKELQRDLSVSYNKIGDIQKAQGDLAAALKSYQDGLAIRKDLAKEDPTNKEWQRDLSISYDNIGNIQQAQGDLAEALNSYQDGLAIRKDLARKDPGNKEWQRDLSISYDNIGNIQQAQGDLAGALKSYKQDLKIAKELAKEDPTNKEWQRDLSVSFNKIGDIQKAQGDLEGALKSYKQDLKIAQDLVREDPSNKQWQRDLLVSYMKIGKIEEAQGDLAGALKSYQDALRIAKELVKEDPGNKQWQRDLSISYDNIGNIQQAQGDLAEALNSYQDGLAIRKELASQDSSNMQWQGDLAYSYIAMSFVDKESAKEHLLKAKDILVGPYEKGLLTADQITNYKAVLGMLDQHK